MSEITALNTDTKRIRTISAAGTILFHLLLLLLMIFITAWTPKRPEMVELVLGGIGGGAGNNPMVTPEPPAVTPKEKEETEKPKVDVPEMKSHSDVTLPATAKKETPKKIKEKLKVTSPSKSHVRSGTGKGSGGGIGNSTGYSIDWGGVTSRKLVMGDIPKYPDGTDKELPVFLQFSVLPDGSVMNIIPLKKSDEILEREAISALQTWRFDALPAQYDQKAQVGKVTFIFKLER